MLLAPCSAVAACSTRHQRLELRHQAVGAEAYAQFLRVALLPVPMSNEAAVTESTKVPRSLAGKQQRRAFGQQNGACVCSNLPSVLVSATHRAYSMVDAQKECVRYPRTHAHTHTHMCNLLHLNMCESCFCWELRPNLVSAVDGVTRHTFCAR